MTRKIKFSLNFNNQLVRTIEEFKEHFDLKEAVECSKDSRLIRWLDVHGYIDYYNKVKEIKSNIDIDIAKDIIEIFSLEIVDFVIEETFKTQSIIEKEIIETQALLFESKYDNRINTAFHKKINNLIKIHYSLFNFGIKDTINDLYSIYFSEISVISKNVLLNAFQYICENNPFVAYEILKNQDMNKILFMNNEIFEITNNLLNKTLIMCEENNDFKKFICDEYFYFQGEDYSVIKVLVIYTNNYPHNKNTIVIMSDCHIYFEPKSYTPIPRNRNIKPIKRKDSKDKLQMLKNIRNNKIPGTIYSKI